jgi:hypothetical protein
VGTQVIAIPTTGAATVRAGEQLFTVRPSEIAVSGSTLSFGTLQQAQFASSVPPTRITAAPGVVVEVGGSTAVVAGTTFRIGEGAPSSAITISGQRIAFGTAGVVLPSTTVAAGAAITAGPAVAVESVGDLTFSVDATQVIIDGSTYRIGSGAPTVRTTVDGQSLSIGTGGIAVGTSTTVRPTSVTITASETGAGASLETGSGDMRGVKSIGIEEWLGWLLMVMFGYMI